MRLAYGNTNLKPKPYGNGNLYTNADAYGGCFSYTYSYRHTITHADVRTRWHTWAVGYCGTGASGTLSRWWNHRWNKRLCLRWW
jgi:hypothetical protein